MNQPLRAPLRGEWLALNPPGHPSHVHDLVRLDPETGRLASEGISKFLFGLLSAQDVHGWSSPVLAPLDGVVVASHDGEPDRDRLIPWFDAPASFIRPLIHRGRLERVAGNHLILSTAAGFILLAHLRQGSLTVCEGDDVRAGQPLGQVGNSGNSMGPHLHIQLMDGADPFASNPIPFRIDELRVLEGEHWIGRSEATLPDRATRIRFAVDDPSS